MVYTSSRTARHHRKTNHVYCLAACKHKVLGAQIDQSMVLSTHYAEYITNLVRPLGWLIIEAILQYDVELVLRNLFSIADQLQ